MGIMEGVVYVQERLLPAQERPEQAVLVLGHGTSIAGEKGSEQMKRAV